MKKPIVILASVLFLAACSKDDNNEPTNPPDPPAPPAVTGAQITVYNATLWSASQPYGVAESSTSVKLYRSADNYPDNPAYTGTTNANGEVSIENVTPGEYYVVAEKEYMHEKISNVLYYIKGVGGYTADSLYQSAPSGGPAPLFGAVGNFMLKDLNFDGKVDMNDRMEFPAQKITITAGKKTAQKILIGYLDNRLFKRLNSTLEINAALTGAYGMLANWHEQQVTLDAVYTDEYDCTALSSNWCTINAYGAVSSDQTISKFWTDGFAIIALAGNILNNTELATGINDADKKMITGQAKALKAYVYMELNKYFGGVPLQDYLLLKPSAIRSSQAETNTFITNLLTSALTDLQAGTINNNMSTMTIPACKALQARFALQQKNYQQVIDYSNFFTGTTFALGSGNSVFTQTSSTEIIWNAAPAMSGNDVKKVFTKGNFIPELRYAEILLIRAEAAVEMGSPSGAQGNLTELRNRAGLSPVTETDLGVLRDLVRQEWKREMGSEGVRFGSLIRWGQDMPVLAPLGYKSNNKFLPIPQSVLAWGPGLMQNAGY